MTEEELIAKIDEITGDEYANVFVQAKSIVLDGDFSFDELIAIAEACKEYLRKSQP